MPPMDLMREMLQEAVAVPLLMSAVVFLVLNFIVRRRVVLAGLLALGCGLHAGNHFRHVLDYQFDVSRPIPSLLVIFLAAGVASLFRGRVGIVLKLLVSAGAAYLVTPKAYHVEWPLPALGVAMFASWLVLERTWIAALSMPALAFAFFTASAVMLYAHSGLLSELAMIVGSCAAGVGVIAWLRGVVVTPAPYLGLLLMAVVRIGYDQTFSQVPMEAFLAIALSPLLLVFSYWQRYLGLIAFVIANGWALVAAARAETLPF